MTIEQWETHLGNADATHEGAEAAAANFILSNLIGYNRRSSKRDLDKQELAKALQAYARLLQKHDVKA